ncbi:MAG: hypothetical protein Q8P62_04725 [Candidatus Peregrinibacteria bacterium]|nr:hypothetical protein [Candidatus Peregrinibacteria bacterium]
MPETKTECPTLANKTALLAAVLAAIGTISGCAHQSAISTSQTVHVNGSGKPHVTCISSGGNGNARVRSTTTINGKTYRCPEN